MAKGQRSRANGMDRSPRPGGARPVKLIFKVDGEKLTGTAKRSSGDAALTGTVKSSDISFSYTVNYNGNDMTLFVHRQSFGRQHQRQRLVRRPGRRLVECQTGPGRKAKNGLRSDAILPATSTAERSGRAYRLQPLNNPLTNNSSE